METNNKYLEILIAYYYGICYNKDNKQITILKGILIMETITENKLKIDVCVRNITRFNEKWMSLPISDDQLNKFLRNSDDEYIIVDYNAPFEISEYANIPTLNETYQKLIESELDNKTLEVLFEASRHDTEQTLEYIINDKYTFIQVDDEESSKFIDDCDCARYLHDNEYISFLGEIPEILYDYMDWDQVWSTCNIEHEWIRYFDQSTSITYLVNI